MRLSRKPECRCSLVPSQKDTSLLKLCFLRSLAVSGCRRYLFPHLSCCFNGVEWSPLRWGMSSRSPALPTRHAATDADSVSSGSPCQNRNVCVCMRAWVCVCLCVLCVFRGGCVCACVGVYVYVYVLYVCVCLYACVLIAESGWLTHRNPSRAA